MSHSKEQKTKQKQTQNTTSINLAFKALKSCTPNPSVCFCNVVQQSGESFTDFLSRVTMAVEQRVHPWPTKEMLIKQLTWEGLSVATRNVVTGSAMMIFANGYLSLGAWTLAQVPLLSWQHPLTVWCLIDSSLLITTSVLRLTAPVGVVAICVGTALMHTPRWSPKCNKGFCWAKYCHF